MFFAIALGRGKLSARHFTLLLATQLLAILIGRLLLLLLLPRHVYAPLATTAHAEWTLVGPALRALPTWTDALTGLAREAATRAPVLAVGTLGLTLAADRLAKSLPEGAWLISPILAICAGSYQWTTNVAYVLCGGVLSRSLQSVWCDVSAVTVGACFAGVFLDMLDQREAKAKEALEKAA